MEKLVSVIVPAYNHEKFISATIQSVISQSYGNWELLVVDDCSTDGSWDIIREYAKKDLRIKVFQNEMNNGLISNWRFLIDNSRGEYISFLEGDDVFCKDNLIEKMAIFKQYPDLGMVYCNFQVVDDNGKILIDDMYRKLNTVTYKNKSINSAEYLFAKSLLFSTYSQIMIKRDVLLISGYPRSLDLNEKVFLPSDWDFNFRVATKNKIYFIDLVLLKYRKHLANNSAATLKVSKQLQMILDDYAMEFSNDQKIQEAIQYMRGKTHYFNVVFYLENGLKKDAWREFFLYIKKYSRNFFHDFILNISLLIRLFLPNRVNAYLRESYFS